MTIIEVPAGADLQQAIIDAPLDAELVLMGAEYGFTPRPGQSGMIVKDSAYSYPFSPVGQPVNLTISSGVGKTRLTKRLSTTLYNPAHKSRVQFKDLVFDVPGIDATSYARLSGESEVIYESCEFLSGNQGVYVTGPPDTGSGHGVPLENTDGEVWFNDCKFMCKNSGIVSSRVRHIHLNDCEFIGHKASGLYTVNSATLGNCVFEGLIDLNDGLTSIPIYAAQTSQPVVVTLDGVVSSNHEIEQVILRGGAVLVGELNMPPELRAVGVNDLLDVIARWGNRSDGTGTNVQDLLVVIQNWGKEKK